MEEPLEKNHPWRERMQVEVQYFHVHAHALTMSQKLRKPGQVDRCAADRQTRRGGTSPLVKVPDVLPEGLQNQQRQIPSLRNNHVRPEVELRSGRLRQAQFRQCLSPAH